MNEVAFREFVHFCQERDSCFFGLSGLVHEGLAERVMAVDEEFISRMKARKILGGRDFGEFAVGAVIAFFTTEDEVPDTIQINVLTVSLQGVREAVVDFTDGEGGGLCG